MELLKNAKGEIVGAVGVKKGKKVFVRAKKAVVLCTGGYEYSRAMRQAFLEGPGINGWAFYGTTSNTGDGIAMGMAVGAGLQKVGKSAARAWGRLPRPWGAPTPSWSITTVSATKRRRR